MKSLQAIQAMEEKPTAIFTSNDFLAYGILMASANMNKLTVLRGTVSLFMHW